uniref:Uncharacterized protein n=1 Tax=Tanacetum cinerariifolium TaxID=118510 RepID=A0A699GJ06_TANCI|nr:hypothetical protein [Tanacetum cinerariifolium]
MTHTDSLSLDKEELKELTASEPTSSSTKPKTSRSKHIKGAIARMSKRYGYIFRHMKKSFLARKDMDAIGNIIEENLKLERENTKADIAVMADEAVRKEQECTRAILSSQMKDDKQAHDADLSILLIVKPCRVDAFRSRDHEDHHDDDALPEEESDAKRQKMFEHVTYTRGESSLSSQAIDDTNLSSSGNQEQQKEFDAWDNKQGTYDDEVPSKEVSPELMDEMSGNEIPAANEQKRMQEALNDMMRNRYPDEVYLEQRIVDVIRVQYDQGHGQKFMKEIVVKRADGKYSHFSKSN